MNKHVQAYTEEILLSKVFNYLDSLKKHVQAHTEEFNFVCAVCKLIVPLF